MDINSLFRGVFPTMAANMTIPAENASADNMRGLAEGILPMLGLRGLLPMYGVLGSWLGLDPTFLLTAFGGFWALNKLLRQLYHIGYGLITEYLMCNIHISSTDDMYLHLMRWLAVQPKMVSSRSLTAETVSKTAWDHEDDTNLSKDLTGNYLNFSNQEAMAPPRFVPAVGLHNFWWQGTYYRLHRKQASIFDDGSSGAGMAGIFKDKEDLVISCLGRSPERIKELLKYCKEQYFKNHHARTIIKRPSPQNLRRYGGRHSWQQVADRPVRDMRTVVLDHQQKHQVLADINEYLHPATPRWYANRGIPLRRGYLFHGPPGTGKTSLSFALAGVFGLDIYVISLLEPTLTEEDLSTLFNSLPRRCVVLLEDIDTAGLRRPAEEFETAEAAKTGSKDEATGTPNDWKVSDLAKALKKEGDDKKGISLSGLLNAIDGVASHEGRVLIMTTNVPERLDAALTRPGRVDLQVGFTNATREQARELFVRMYEADQSRRQQAYLLPYTNRDSKEVVVANGKAGSNGYIKVSETQSTINSGDLDISPEKLPQVANEFADKIPNGAFSPAEIQGFLLKRKKHPLKALEDADKWVEGMKRQKASKSKILDVQ